MLAEFGARPELLVTSNQTQAGVCERIGVIPEFMFDGHYGMPLLDCNASVATIVQMLGYKRLHRVRLYPADQQAFTAQLSATQQHCVVLHI